MPIPGPRAVPLAARSTPGAARHVRELAGVDRRSGRRPVRLRAGDAGGRQDPGRLAAASSRCRKAHASDSRDAALSLENAAFSQQPLYAPAGRHRRRRLRGHRRPAGLDRLRIARRGPGRAGSILARSDWSVRRRIRRVLVAAGLDWFPYSGGGPSVPSPAAAGAPGAWRSGASGRFVLVEVPLTAITSGSNVAVGQPQIGRTASQDGVIELRLATRDPSARPRRTGHGDHPMPATRRRSPTLPGSSTRMCWTGSSAGWSCPMSRAERRRHAIVDVVAIRPPRQRADARGGVRRQLDRHRRRAGRHGDPLRPGPGISVDRYASRPSPASTLRR